MITKVGFFRNEVGVSGARSTFTVTDSAFVGNSAAGVTGPYSTITVHRSTFHTNGVAVIGPDGPVTVSRSTFTGNELPVYCSFNDCRVTGSKIVKNDKGVFAWESRLTLKGNVITGNGVGVDIANNSNPPDDLYTGDVSGNHFTGNDVAVSLGQGVRSNVHDNVFRGNRRAIALGSQTTELSAVLLDRNLLVRNTDAIYLQAPANPGVELKGNRAFQNTGWGIYAPGAVDLGGNVARGNGNQPQCVGVVCPAS